MLGNFHSSNEHKELEFKEFYLKINPDFILTDLQLKNIVINNIWIKDMNHIIDINIINYLKYYMPKYISCFLNSNINGKLVIGINDDSEITGIPYLGEINVSQIKEYVKRKIPKYIKGIPNIDNVSISIDKLDIDANILDDNASEQIKIMNSNLLKYNMINQKYKDKKRKWLKEISKYSTRFYNILNVSESRNKLLEFCIERNAKKEIINLLKSNDEIQIDLNEHFYLRFKDVNDVVYWAGEFKDYNIERLQKIKPIRDELPKLISHSMILSRISDMNYRFFTNNDNINFYTITINISNIKTSEPVQFRIPGSKNWYYRERVSLPGGPGCI